MDIRKEIKDDNELYLWMNGTLIYKRWINHGYSKVFDRSAYGKDTFMSIAEDEQGQIRKRRRMFINGYFCQSEADFWEKYSAEIPGDSARYFGKNMAAFHDAITGGGPGYPGECLLEIIGTSNLIDIFGRGKFNQIIDLLERADFVDLVVEKAQ